MIRIVPDRPSYPPDGPPPRFRVDGSGHRYFGVQLATHAFLLSEASAGRRARTNFFDSWLGRPAGAGRPAGEAVAAAQLECDDAGTVEYAVPGLVWGQMKSNQRIFYRVVTTNDRRRTRRWSSIADVNWEKAPSIAVTKLTKAATRNPVAAFKGRDVLKRPDFLDTARQLMGVTPVVHGRDRDLHFVVLDAGKVDMTLIESHEHGLTGTVDKMALKPDAAVNAQFVSGRTGVGIGMEGQDIRESVLINADSRGDRLYVAQMPGAVSVDGIRIGRGNPKTAVPDARVAVGGLGPILTGGARAGRLSAWATSIYDMPIAKGRGAIALDRNRKLIVIVVQADRTGLFDSVANALSMRDLAILLKSMGCSDAVFNDGSDSESLFAAGGWLVEPGRAKNSAIDFAVGFVQRARARRMRFLAIDGTTSGDGRAVVTGLSGTSPLTNFRPGNLVQALSTQPSLSGIRTAFRDGQLNAGRLANQSQMNTVGQLFRLGGNAGQWADLLYLSCHAWRHGQLWCHKGGGDSGPILMIADPWSSGFRLSWNRSPRWVVLAGCAVLGLHYARLVPLNATERGHLVDWHRDIHGSGAAVPGLTNAKQILFAVYHPGWAWYQRALRSSGVRGVLGYWFRSPGGDAGDVTIIENFMSKLRDGASFLDAWKDANQRGLFEAQAAWAAMVRSGCEGDGLGVLERADLGAADGEFRYHDRWQDGQPLPTAFKEANKRTGTVAIGSTSVTTSGRDRYDRIAFGKDLQDLQVVATAANLLTYDDGVHP